jgi:hypothetical protein
MDPSVIPLGLQKQSEDGVEKSETYGRLCWQLNQSLPACARPL